MMRINHLFKGWWICSSDREEPWQPPEGYDMRIGLPEDRGPFPTKEIAEKFRWQDDVPSYWEHGLPVWARPCLRCGKFAKTLAGSDLGGGWAWCVTECKKCGVLDSRCKDQP